MSKTSAKIITDSISEYGDRVTSFEITFHRFVLSEFNTHCVFARNSASSRAIPVSKQLEKYTNDPAYPISWPAEQKGMSGGHQLEGKDLEDAMNLFFQLNAKTAEALRLYVEEHEPEHRLHKSVLNRLMEPMQSHTALVTAGSYENFFDLRVNPAAQPEIKAVAELMQEIYRKNDPKVLKNGEWHLPYIREDDATDGSYDLRKISSMRSARLSYLTQNGIRDLSEDNARYGDLVNSGHWSPLEHICTPMYYNRQFVDFPDPDTGIILPGRTLPNIGKFIGFLQWRHVVEARMKINTYR